MKKQFFVLFSAFVVLHGCNSKQLERKRGCTDFYVYKEGKPVRIDSCFTSYSSDSLEMILDNVRKQQAQELEIFETRLLVIFVDTLQKEQKDYQYAIALSEAGTINSDVILTRDASIVKEKCRPYHPKNIIIRKLRVGENIKGMVEDFFKHNVRINYRTISNEKIDS